MSPQGAWTPAGTARVASKGAWKLYRHASLFNRLGLSLAAGEIKNLLVEIQPQIGKSEFWSRYFPAWYVGTYPDRRIALASYAADYARRWGRQARAVIEEHGAELFKIGVAQDSHKADDWSIAGREGGMITAGVGGQITGRRADLIIVDDPIKNAEEAESKARKDLIWDWWESTICSRENESTAKIVMHTRWAEDDLAGRIRTEYIDKGKEPWTVIRLPAIAEADEDLFGGLWTRKKGDVVCPERFSKAFLEAKKNRTTSYWWETLYQQHPRARGGGQIKTHWFQVVAAAPPARRAVRAWDLAASEDEKNKQTAGVRTIIADDGLYYLTNVQAFWKTAGARDNEIAAIATEDGAETEVSLEQEGGSGGIAQIDYIFKRREFDNRVCHVSKARGSKELRADAFASAAERGKVRLVDGPWVKAFKEQIERFPKGLIDMVDAAAHAHNLLAGEDEIPDVPEGFDPASAGRSPIFPIVGPGSLFG